jgi:hypothetical protein
MGAPTRRLLCPVLIALACAGCGSPSPAPRARLDPSAPRFGPAPGWRPPALALRSAAGGRIGRLRCTHARGGRFGAHLELFVDGLDVVIPPGVGVALPQHRHGAYVTGGRCSYPLRTSDPTGVIEVTRRAALTLGDFFDVWGQPLSERRVLGFSAGARRRLTVFVNGQRWRGRVRTVALRRHASIVVELGRHVARHPVYLFPAGQ